MSENGAQVKNSPSSAKADEQKGPNSLERRALLIQIRRRPTPPTRRPYSSIGAGGLKLKKRPPAHLAAHEI